MRTHGFANPEYVPAWYYVLQSFHLWARARLAFRSVRWHGARGKFRHCFLLCKCCGLTRLCARLQPMTDLSILLSKLVTSKGEILIPGLSELVTPLTGEEKDRYNALDYSVSVWKCPRNSTMGLSLAYPGLIGCGFRSRLAQLRYRMTRRRCSWVACDT